MNQVFVDTAGWVALKDKSDGSHDAAELLNKSLLLQKRRYVTTNFVLDETYTLLRIRTGHNVAVEFGEEIRASKVIKVVHIFQEIEEEAWQLFKRFHDKEFSFTDCTSFIVMRHEGIWECFTGDHHFEQMGYQKLL